MGYGTNSWFIFLSYLTSVYAPPGKIDEHWNCIICPICIIISLSEIAQTVWCFGADGSGAQTHVAALTTLTTTLARRRGSGRMWTWWTTSSSFSRCARTEPSTTSPAVHSTPHRPWPVMIHSAHFLKAGVSCLEHVHSRPLLTCTFMVVQSYSTLKLNCSSAAG